MPSTKTRGIKRRVTRFRIIFSFISLHVKHRNVSKHAAVLPYFTLIINGINSLNALPLFTLHTPLTQNALYSIYFNNMYVPYEISTTLICSLNFLYIMCIIFNMYHSLMDYKHKQWIHHPCLEIKFYFRFLYNGNIALIPREKKIMKMFNFPFI